MHRPLSKKRISVLPPSVQDQLNKQRAAEMRLEAERKRLREALEAAEARATRVELVRRSLEGELQRLKLSLGDREAESQTSQERHDSLLKQVEQAHTESFSFHIPECLIRLFATLNMMLEILYCVMSQSNKPNDWTKKHLDQMMI